MSGHLQQHDGDSFLKCSICGGDAAGPCIKCRQAVCGDCCVLVEGAATQWAVCLRCEKRPDGQVGGWMGLGLFFVKVVLGLLTVILLLAWLVGDIG